MSKFAGVVLTPSRVLISNGNTAPKKMMPTLDKDADAKPDDDQRQEGDARRGIHGVDEWIANVCEALVPADGDAKGNRENDRQEVAPEELDAADIEVVVNLPEANICQAALPTSEGALMNMGLMSPAQLPMVSQVKRKRITAVVPRIFFS